MAHVSVTIAGRAYRMACDEGQEAHLEHLGEVFNGKIESLRGSFGEVGDNRLVVMAGVMLADELLEAQNRVAQLEEIVGALQQAQAEADADTDVVEAEIARAVAEAASRIEAVATRLETR